jgi:glycine/D-amino acid oxidase-like deaminating enzyme
MFMNVETKDQNTHVAVIGGGIFGCLISIELARRGCVVNLYERNSEIMVGASLNNQNRLHLGYHYPRDDNTALQCIKGFNKFKLAFSNCVLGDFQNNYYISSRDSKVSMPEYEEFCRRVGLPVSPVSVDFPVEVQNVMGGLSTKEVVYDSRLLAQEVQELLAQSKVSVFCNHDITGVNKDASAKFNLKSGNVEVGKFNKVINCTYANYNRFNKDLGLDDQLLQYEYTLVPIIKWLEKPVGITIMDGDFMTVLPFGLSGNSLLYHVEHTVVESEISHNLNQAWLSKPSSPAQYIDKELHFKKMLKACIEFVPELSSAELVGFLEGPRVVFSGKETTDERPSVINVLDKDGFFAVFSGKIDHSIWVADHVAEMIVNN